jgi:hypothetical protein
LVKKTFAAGSGHPSTSKTSMLRYSVIASLSADSEVPFVRMRSSPTGNFWAGGGRDVLVPIVGGSSIETKKPQTASAKQLSAKRTIRNRLLIGCSRSRRTREERIHGTGAAGSALQWHKQGVVGSHLAAYESQYVSQN